MSNFYYFDRRTRIALGVGTILIYILIFNPFYDLVSRSVISISIIPILVISNNFGLRGGIISSLLFIPLNWLLYISVGEPTDAFLGRNFWTSHIVFLLVGIISGHLHNIRNTIQKELGNMRETEQFLNHMATHDPLTGLPNRSLFFDRVNHSLLKAKRYSKGTAIVFLDIDNFKSINDTHGHEIGDQVLSIIAKRLSQSVRSSDTISRFAGDEFTILLEDVTEKQDVITILDKIVEALSEPILIDTIELSVSGSFGVSLYPDGGDEASTLIRNADKAMYRVKKKGKKSYSFYLNQEKLIR